jgi:hypothetical protein
MISNVHESTKTVFQKSFGPLNSAQLFFHLFMYLEEHEGHRAPVTFPTKQTERAKQKISLKEYLKV